MSRSNYKRPTVGYTTDMLETIYQAQKLLEYTIKILNNEKNFDPIYDDVFKNDLKYNCLLENPYNLIFPWGNKKILFAKLAK